MAANRAHALHRLGTGPLKRTGRRARHPSLPSDPSAYVPAVLRADFLGAPVDCCTLQQVVELATAAMKHRRRLQHGDVNVAKFIDFRSDPELYRCTAESDIVCPDGMGIVWGCQLLGLPIRERVTGIDLMMRVIEVCAQTGFKPYFLGARQAILERAIAGVQARYPGLTVAGWRNGYFRAQDEPGIVAEIRSSGADCLFVGISSPMKERFLNRYRDAVGVPLLIGVGGAFDVLGGHVPRAPAWMQRYGLEWLFRLANEPLRLGPRYVRTNTQYLAILLFALARSALKRLLGRQDPDHASALRHRH